MYFSLDLCIQPTFLYVSRYQVGGSRYKLERLELPERLVGRLSGRRVPAGGAVFGGRVSFESVCCYLGLTG